jgi:hypothetical protein
VVEDLCKGITRVLLILKSRTFRHLEISLRLLLIAKLLRIKILILILVFILKGIKWLIKRRKAHLCRELVSWRVNMRNMKIILSR